MIIKLLKFFRISLILLFSFVLFCIFNYNKIDFPDRNKIYANNLSIKELKLLIKQINPILKNLVKKTNFKYFRVDVDRECPTKNENICKSKKNCDLKCECKEEDLPKTWLDEDKKLIQNTKVSKSEIFDIYKPQKKQLIKTLKYGWTFDQVTPKTRYVDLTADREEYTGYQGQEIWSQIYTNMCLNTYKQCNDNKFLFKMISGMHSSISSHLTYNHKTSKNQTHHNLSSFYTKVGKHKERISNLFFAVNILIRAFNRYYPYIQDIPVDTGDFGEDFITKQLLDELSGFIEIVKDKVFEESDVFGSLIEEDQKKEIFIRYFSDVINLIDCVDCKKCRVYGKMQILGMGVAVRILMQKSGDLSRNEFLAFVNTLAKWVESVEILDEFSRMIVRRKQHEVVYLTCLFGVILYLVQYFLKKFNKNNK